MEFLDGFAEEADPDDREMLRCVARCPFAPAIFVAVCQKAFKRPRQHQRGSVCSGRDMPLEAGRQCVQGVSHHAAG